MAGAMPIGVAEMPRPLTDGAQHPSEEVILVA